MEAVSSTPTVLPPRSLRPPKAAFHIFADGRSAVWGYQRSCLGRVGVLWCVNKQSRRCEYPTNVVWSYVLVRYYGSGVVQRWLSSPQLVGYMIVWLEVSRGGIQVVSSRRSTDGMYVVAMRLYNADYKATGVRQKE